MKSNYPKLIDLMNENSNFINEFLDDIVSAGLDAAGKAAEVGLSTATDVLKTPGAEDMMTNLLKTSGVDKVGLELFKSMFPKSGTFLKYLRSKNVDETDFAVAFSMVLFEKAAAGGVRIPKSISNVDDKIADIVADSVLVTLEGMDVKFGAELFGIKIPGSESFEKKKLKDETRKAVKDAIKPILILGKDVKMPTGIVKEGLSRGSLYRMRYHGRY